MVFLVFANVAPRRSPGDVGGKPGAVIASGTKYLVPDSLTVTSETESRRAGCLTDLGIAAWNHAVGFNRSRILAP